MSTRCCESLHADPYHIVDDTTCMQQDCEKLHCFPVHPNLVLKPRIIISLGGNRYSSDWQVLYTDSFISSLESVKWLAVYWTCPLIIAFSSEIHIVIEEYLRECYLPCICPMLCINCDTHCSSNHLVLASHLLYNYRILPRQWTTHRVIRIQNNNECQLWYPRVPVLPAGVIFLQRLSISNGWWKSSWPLILTQLAEDKTAYR